jgi:hypothetical protein
LVARKVFLKFLQHFEQSYVHHLEEFVNQHSKQGMLMSINRLTIFQRTTED